jgi:endonuclease/exonuclease/phosphatase family metal-dependent hydrolase
MEVDEAATVRVMTWNIHGGIGPDGHVDIDRVVKLIRRHDPDILALQEVDSRRSRYMPENVFEHLAEGLGSHSAEARLITAPDGDFGHVLISRWPISRTKLHDISVPRREPRAAMETTVATPAGPLHLVAAHLGLGFKERRKQAATLAAAAQSSPERTIMLGDFNDWFWRGAVEGALGPIFQERTRHKTFPARFPLLDLDRVYCRPAGTLVRSWTDPLAYETSDHLPVIAELSLTR